MSRYHLCQEVLRRVQRPIEHAPALLAHCDEMLVRHRGWIREHLEDMPEVRDWVWTEA